MSGNEVKKQAASPPLDITTEEKVKEIEAEGSRMQTNVKKVTASDYDRIQLEVASGYTYAVNESWHGRAIIIGNSKFQKRKPLPGVAVDVKNLEQLFSRLSFDTFVWMDQSMSELKRKLAGEQQRSEHSAADAFVLCVTSHGDEGVFITADDQQFKVTDIVSYFNGENCYPLRNRPKLFLIDTCQGGMSTDGITEKAADLQLSQQMAQRLKGQITALNSDDKIHPLANIIIFYSTVTGYTAYDYGTLGSPFIRSLVYVLSRKSHAHHFMEMAREVTCIMSKMEIGKKLQVPQLVLSGVLKYVYLLPGQSRERFVTFKRATEILQEELDYPEDRALYFIKRFDHNGDGKLSPTEFGLFKAQIAETKRQMMPKFRELDKDGDGYITFDEAAKVNLPVHHVFELMHVFDKDGNGKLDINEFTGFYAVTKAMSEPIVGCFKKLDKDRKGAVKLQQVATVIRDQLRTDEKTALDMAKMFDRNNDGVIDEKEFVDMWWAVFGKPA